MRSFGISKMGFAEYKARQPMESTRFYVYIRLDDYFPYEVKDAEYTHYSFMILDPFDLHQRLYAFIPKSQGEDLVQATKDGESHYAVLEVSLIPGSTSVKMVTIDKVIALNSWLDVNK